MSNENLQPGKLDRKKMQVVQEIFHNLSEVVELYPQFSISQHLSTILRRKSSDAKEFFHWNNDELLKKIEQHKEELEGEDLMNIETED
jgi:hypothetical protein